MDKSTQSDWTIGTLKEYIERRLTDQDKAADAALIATQKATEAALIAAQKATESALVSTQKATESALLASKEAVVKAETATDKRFDSVNEFRAQLADQTATFIARPEYSAGHKSLEDKVTTLTDRVNIHDGITKGSGISKEEMYKAVGISMTVLGFILTIVLFVISKMVE